MRFPGENGQDVVILMDVNLEVRNREVFGLIGETGAGKSLTAWAAVGLVPPPGRITKGHVYFNGRDVGTESGELSSLRGNSIGIIVQDPRSTLNPIMPVGKQVAIAYRTHNKVSRGNARELALEALAEVQIRNPKVCAGLYPHQLSGGMAQRVLIAMAIINRPQLIIADEPTTGLDVTVQADILDLLINLARQERSSLWLITHDLGIVINYTDRAGVMFAGQVVESAPTASLFSDPRHPYTIGLKDAIESEIGQLAALQVGGPPPNLEPRLPGCQFAYRCPWFLESCQDDSPQLKSVLAQHEVRCFVAQQLSMTGQRDSLQRTAGSTDAVS